MLLPERPSQYSTRKRPSFSTAGSYRGLPLSSVGTETAELAAPGTPVAGGSRAQPQPKVRARAVQTAPQPIRKTTRFIKTTPLQKQGGKFFRSLRIRNSRIFHCRTCRKMRLKTVTIALQLCRGMGRFCLVHLLQLPQKGQQKGQRNEEGERIRNGLAELHAHKTQHPGQY